MTRLSVLDTPRHRCLTCGNCCSGGLFIEVGDDERPRIERLAAGLGVEDPVVDGGLRMDAGVCVFLDDDRLCRLHKQAGPEAKPLTCQQFPFAAVRTEQGVRAGIDPACSTAWRTWRDGPERIPERIKPRERVLREDQREGERALIAALGRSETTVAGMLHLLTTGRPGGPALPGGFARRWILRLRELDLAQFLADDDTGPGLARPLAALPAAIAALDPDDPPDWPVLSSEQDAWAVEVTRRMLFLRLAPLIPAVQAVALFTLGGAVTCGWAHTEPERFGPALAGWSRAIRFRRLWRRLAPDAATLQWLATGRGAAAT